MLAVLALFVAPAALAQSSSNAEAAASDLPPGQLADLLENDDARARIVEQLRAAAGPPDQTPVLPEPPAEAPSEEGAGLAAGTAERAAASAERVSFARRFAETTADWAGVIGERLGTAWAVVANLHRDRGPGPAFDLSAFTAAAITFGLVAIATVASFFVLRLLASFLFAAVGRFANRAESGVGVMVRRFSAITFALAIDIGVVLLACGAGYMAGLYAFGEQGSIGTRESLFINAFALIELTKVAIRGVFAARYENLRLVNIPSDIAHWWSLRLRWFVGIIGYGLLVLVPIVNVQVSFFIGAVVSFIIMGASYLYALTVIFRNRRLLTERIQLMAERSTVGFFSALLRLAAKLWLILALAYFTTLFVSSQVDPDGALPYMLSATLQTLVAAAVGFGISGLLSKAIGKRVTLSDNLRERLPRLEGRVNAYVPNALKVVRVVILVAVALIVANAWGLFDLGAWLTSDSGLHTLSMLGRVAIVLAMAALIWLIVASVIEHKLSPSTGAGRPSARQETLLELFRNALAIVIITMTLMITLSQIGVDIGPLIAGAGVLGLAIGFGAQKLVQDIITGIFIQLENAMNTGDVVTVGGVTGTAERLTIRSVSIRDLDGAYHIVPFSSASQVTNYMRDFAYHRTEYGIAYREDIDNAVAHMRAAFEELKADPTHGPNILEDMTVPGVTALADSSVNIRIMIKTKPGTQWGIGRAFNRLVKIHFDRAGIEIPFPHQTLYFGVDHDGSAPPAHLRVAEAPSSSERAPTKKRMRGDDAAPADTGDAPEDV